MTTQSRKTCGNLWLDQGLSIIETTIQPAFLLFVFQQFLGQVQTDSRENEEGDPRKITFVAFRTSEIREWIIIPLFDSVYFQHLQSNRTSRPI